MRNKWKFPTKNVMEKYFSMREQLEKTEKQAIQSLAGLLLIFALMLITAYIEAL